MTRARPRGVAVLGAGVLGLVAALRLAQRGDQVTVMEREPLPGGLASGFEVEPGIWLEKFYHHLFRSDRHAIGLIEELGLGADLRWSAPPTVTLRDGVLHRLDSPASLLRFGPLPVVDRLRMGAALAYLRTLSSPDRLEDQMAGTWIRRRMGRRSYEVVWGPLLRGKFGDAADEIAMPWFWARVHDRTTQLGYLAGGFQHLYDALAARLDQLGVTLQFETTVEQISPANVGLSVTSRRPDGTSATESFDAVISTLPTRLTIRLTPGLPEAYRERHDWGRAYGAHCLILALDRPLTGAYWVNVNDPGFPFMALVEHTNYQRSSAYGGRHLLYLGNYRPMHDELFTLETDAVVQRFAPSLVRLNPAFDASWITGTWSFAAPFAQPIVTTDYRQHIPPFETPIPGLFVANMFQVYPHDRGQNYSIALAERLVFAVAGAG